MMMTERHSTESPAAVRRRWDTGLLFLGKDEDGRLILDPIGHEFTLHRPNGRAYNRATFLEQRRKMLQEWADYLDKLRSGIVAVEAVA